jgi:hypothetical protein
MVVCSAATFLPQYTLNSSFNDLIAYLILSGIEKTVGAALAHKK